MNRNLKKIIGIIFAVGIFSAITPTTNLITTKAYADDGITSLEIETSDGDARNLYDDSDCESNHKVENDELESGKTYYTKTPTDKIKISVNGVDSDCVRVFGGDSSDTGEKIGSSIDLSSGTTTITIRIYSQDPGDVEFSDDSYISQYKIKVKYTGSDNEDDEELDNVYLKSISLTPGNIDFAMRTYTYDINVAEDCSKITIGARPDCDNDEYDNYKVKIAGIKVDRDDKFKEDISLSKGKNVIEIKVEDDEDNERIYTLNITRGEVDKANNSNSENVSTNIKANQWVQANSKWQYNDATGNPVKNTWMQNCYLQDNGDMATGWLNYGGNWYYLGEDGYKKTGWQSIGENWYYLDLQGKIQTGWFKDVDGKYYYLNSFGAMAYNTTIDGYKLGVNGAWIGR